MSPPAASAPHFLTQSSQGEAGTRVTGRSHPAPSWLGCSGPKVGVCWRAPVPWSCLCCLNGSAEAGTGSERFSHTLLLTQEEAQSEYSSILLHWASQRQSSFTDAQNLNLCEAPLLFFFFFKILPTPSHSPSFLDVAMETASGFHSLPFSHVPAQSQRRHRRDIDQRCNEPAPREPSWPAAPSM